MNKNLIFYIVTTALFWCIFGWKAMIFAAFFGLFVWFAPSQKTTASSNTYPFFLWSDKDDGK